MLRQSHLAMGVFPPRPLVSYSLTKVVFFLPFFCNCLSIIFFEKSNIHKNWFLALVILIEAYLEGIHGNSKAWRDIQIAFDPL